MDPFEQHFVTSEKVPPAATYDPWGFLQNSDAPRLAAEPEPSDWPANWKEFEIDEVRSRDVPTY